MSYSSGIDQRFLSQTFYNNTTAIDQPITQTNLSLIANLAYVKNWLSSVISNYLPILNPNFQGTLTSSTGGSINLTNTNSYLRVPTITGNVNFTGQPTVQYNNKKYQISIRVVGDIKMFISNIAPPYYLKCDGSLYSTTQYSALFNIISYTYGGSGQYFAVPNFTSSFPIGANSANLEGCPISNFATGNGTSGATNTYSTSVNFGGEISSVPPVLAVAPPHSHNINDPGHDHISNITDVEYNLIIIPPIYNVLVAGDTGNTVGRSYTDITLQNTGTNIQATDPVSGLPGVNITPPYVAVFYYIAYD